MKQKKVSFMEHWNSLHTNPPAPFNPDYDLTSDKWWPIYCAKRREALIAKYLELYPGGKVDGAHFNEVRNEILRNHVDQFNASFIKEAKENLQ